MLAIHQYPPGPQEWSQALHTVPQKWYSHLLLTPFQMIGVVMIPHQLTNSPLDSGTGLGPQSTSIQTPGALVSCLYTHHVPRSCS